MKCEIKPQGKIDHESGEFWVNNPFEMVSGKHNFSAYESNKLLINRMGDSFVDLSYESGANIDSDSRSAIAADFDRDGDLDLLIASVGGGAMRLFDNQIPRQNNRIKVLLRGTTSNRQGIGARLIAQVGDRTVVRDLFAANGFMGQSPAELVLGVGQATKIDSLSVRWPDGKIDHYDDVPVSKSMQIVQGESSITADSDRY